MRQQFLLLAGLFFAQLALAATPEIALVQYNADLHFNDYHYNLSELTRYAEEAASKGAQIIVLPEGSAYGYAGAHSYWCSQDRWPQPGCKDVAQIAEAVPGGQTTSYWEKFSKDHGVYVAFNLPEVSGGNFYNTTGITGPQGYVTKYRKRSLYIIDTYYATPGDLGPVILETPIGKFGLLICMDLNYERYYTQYKNLGVTKILADMDWDQDPYGANGSAPAITYLQKVANGNGVDLFVSDVSPWDGTGAYRHGQIARERNGLPTVAVDQDGISYHSVN